MRRSHQAGKFLTLFFTFTLGALSIANAQTTIETGLSIGFNRHTFSVDNGDNARLQPGIALAATYGLPIIITKNNWELHTGIYANNLSQSYYFRTSGGATLGKRSFSNGISSYKIPLRIGRTIQWTEKTSLSPQIGFAWLTSQRTGLTGYESGSHIRFRNHVEYTAENRTVSKQKFFLETGLDINIALFREIDLTLGTQYSLGLQTIEKMNVSYQINSGLPYSGTVNSKGSGWKFSIGIKFPIVTGC